MTHPQYEVLKNKCTPHYQKEFDGESEKNNRFVPRELIFDQIPFFKKRLSSKKKIKKNFSGTTW